MDDSVRPLSGLEVIVLLLMYFSLVLIAIIMWLLIVVEGQDLSVHRFMEIIWVRVGGNLSLFCMLGLLSLLEFPAILHVICNLPPRLLIDKPAMQHWFVNIIGLYSLLPLFIARAVEENLGFLPPGGSLGGLLLVGLIVDVALLFWVFWVLVGVCRSFQGR